MMKNILVVILFCVTSVSSYGQEVKGKMICKVKSNFIASIDEGVSEVYSRIEDSFSEGDNLIFSFEFKPSKISIDRILVALDYKNESLMYRSLSGVTIKLIDNGFTVDDVFVGQPIRNFDSNRIDIEDFYSANLFLKRYYKNDWSGRLTRTFYPSTTSQIATLDCRQSSDKVDDFIREVRKLAE
jgi:hypothetical protein